MNEPLLVEVIAYAPTAFYHCMHCEVAFREMGKSEKVQNEQLVSSLPPDLLQEYQSLSDWVRELMRVHCDRVVISVIDAASVEGVIKSLRYGTRRFPAVIVDRRDRFAGKDALARAADMVDSVLSPQHLTAPPA
jgi:uncharacterized protein DUF1525